MPATTPVILPAVRVVEGAEPAMALGLDPKALAEIGEDVEGAMARGEIPGAVVLVARAGRVALRKAWGVRVGAEPLGVDTPFDLASLTKPLATSLAIAALVDRRVLSPGDRVARWLPAFAVRGKETITIEQLLLHVGGLPADDPIAGYGDGPEAARARLLALAPVADPGAAFLYSDAGYLALGQVVERASGRPLDAFVREAVYAPLGLRSIGFRPDATTAARAAPTERRGDGWITGEVHDPRAAALGGVAGHAGLFGTADAVAALATAMLHGGELGGARFLPARTARDFTTPRPVPGGQRALGWDVATDMTGERGDRFPIGGFGHTGFTGTSVWADPASDTVVVVLTSRLYPDGKGDARPLRRLVATRVAESIVRAPTPGDVAPPLAPAADAPVHTGIDVLVARGPGSLAGRRVGLVTNDAARDRLGRRTTDALLAAGVNVVVLLAPEHGLAVDAEGELPGGTDRATGLPVRSLYGARRAPGDAELAGVDALVVDLPDIGARFFTYESTLALVLEAAAARRLPVVVLDRPSPLGDEVEGPVLEASRASFVGMHPLPVRHGLTLGELARLFVSERRLDVALEVVGVEGWRRTMRFEDTGLPWVAPSPNLPRLAAARLYPGVALLETTNVSVGRGTGRPFELVGAPWIDGVRLATALRGETLPGAQVEPATFTPSASVYAGERCHGVRLVIDDPDALKPVRVGLAIARALRATHGDAWKGERMLTLLGHAPTLDAILRGDGVDAIDRAGAAERDAFVARRAAFLLYP